MRVVVPRTQVRRVARRCGAGIAPRGHSRARVGGWTTPRCVRARHTVEHGAVADWRPHRAPGIVVCARDRGDTVAAVRGRGTHTHVGGRVRHAGRIFGHERGVWLQSAGLGQQRRAGHKCVPSGCRGECDLLKLLTLRGAHARDPSDVQIGHSVAMWAGRHHWVDLLAHGVHHRYARKRVHGGALTRRQHRSDGHKAAGRAGHGAGTVQHAAADAGLVVCSHKTVALHLRKLLRAFLKVCRVHHRGHYEATRWARGVGLASGYVVHHAVDPDEPHRCSVVHADLFSGAAPSRGDEVLLRVIVHL
eukprot:PhM_4_TR13275/c5_g1_i1/m.105695